MQKEKQTGLFAAPFPSQVPFAHLAGLERPGWGRTSPRPPLPSLNPPEQPLGLPGEIHPLKFLLLRTAAAPRRQKQNLPSWAVVTQIPRAAWSKRCPENLPGCRGCLRAQGRGLSSHSALSALSVRPLCSSQEGNSCGKGGPGRCRGRSSPARSGVYFSSSETCRSRISSSSSQPPSLEQRSVMTGAHPGNPSCASYSK